MRCRQRSLKLIQKIKYFFQKQAVLGSEEREGRSVFTYARVSSDDADTKMRSLLKKWISTQAAEEVPLLRV